MTHRPLARGSSYALALALTIALVSLLPVAALAQDSRGIALYKEGKFAEAASALTAEAEQQPVFVLFWKGT